MVKDVVILDVIAYAPMYACLLVVILVDLYQRVTVIVPMVVVVAHVI